MSAFSFQFEQLNGKSTSGLTLDSNGRLETSQEQSSVKNALKMIFYTRPGERVMNPEYGCDLFKLIYEPNDGATEGMAIYYVKSAIQKWEPRIEIIECDAYHKKESPHILDIVLTYKIKSLGVKDQLQLSIQTQGS